MWLSIFPFILLIMLNFVRNRYEEGNAEGHKEGDGSRWQGGAKYHSTARVSARSWMTKLVE